MHYNHPFITTPDTFYDLWSDIPVHVNSEDDRLFQETGHATTYGYLTPLGFLRLLDAYTMHHPKHAYPKVFYDIGSGLGMPCVLAVSLLSKLEAHGIELSHERHQNAKTVRNKLPQPVRKRLHLHNVDALHYKKYSDADMIYISNLCFPEHHSQAIGTILTKQLRPGTHVFTSRPLVTLEHSFEQVFNVPQSWQQSSQVFHYIV